MHYPQPLPEPFGNSSFTLQEAFHQEISKGRLRSNKLRVTSRGIRTCTYFSGGHDAWVRHYTVVTHRCAASHASAEVLWQLPAVRPLKAVRMIHITRPAGFVARRRKGVIGHQSKLLPGAAVWHHGVPVTSRERTWLDLAEDYSVD